MSESTPEVQWIPVLGFEGMYEISDRGQIRSLGRYVRGPKDRWGNPLVQWRQGRVLTPKSNGPSGHLTVVLRNDGVGGPRGVHVLIAENFHGPRPEGHWALHKNDIPTDNRPDNIYWGTPKQNSADAIRNGRHRNARKEQCDRGHDLVEPNILWTNDARRCRACNRAWHRLRRRGTMTAEAMATESDLCYRKIMS